MGHEPADGSNVRNGTLKGNTAETQAAWQRGSAGNTTRQGCSFNEIAMLYAWQRFRFGEGLSNPVQQPIHCIACVVSELKLLSIALHQLKMLHRKLDISYA